MRSLREKTESSEFFNTFDEKIISNYFIEKCIDERFNHDDIKFENILNLSQFELVTKYISLYYLNKGADQVFYTNIRGAVNVDELFKNGDASISYVADFIEKFYSSKERDDELGNLVKYSDLLATYEIFNRCPNVIFQSPFVLRSSSSSIPGYNEIVKNVVDRNLAFIKNFLPGNDLYKINEFRIEDMHHEQLKCCTRCYTDLDLEKLFIFLPTQNEPTVLDEVEIFMDYYYLLEKDINLYSNIKELILVCPLTNKVFICELKNCLKPIEENNKTYPSIIHKIVIDFMSSDKHSDNELPTAFIYGDYESLNKKIQSKSEEFLFKFLYLEKNMCEMFYVLKTNHFIGVDPKAYGDFKRISDFLRYESETHNVELKRFRVDFSELKKLTTLRNYITHNYYVDLMYNISQLNKYNQSVILIDYIEKMDKLLDKNIKRIQKIPGNNLVKIKRNYEDALSSDYYSRIADYGMNCRNILQMNEYYVGALLTSIVSEGPFEDSLAHNRFTNVGEGIAVLYHADFITEYEYETIKRTTNSRNYCLHNAPLNLLTRGIDFCNALMTREIENASNKDDVYESNKILLTVFEALCRSDNLETDTTKESTTLI